MRNKIKHILLILLSVISINAIAQNFPEKSNPPRIVNDYTNFLSAQENSTLENKMVQFNNQSSTQIAIVIVKSLDGYDPASYAFGLGEKWGIGQKGKNNGILILVKPKYQNSKGEVYIATGYGLEGAVPDAITKRIVNNEILPYFKQGMYYKGLDEATNRIIELTRGEYTADEYQQATGKKGSAIPGGIIFLIIIAISFIGRAKRARHYSVGHNVPFWIALGMLSSNRSHGGSYGNFSSGGGSFGGGGGFGGFGGGSFGGGGAGGSW
ncbi:MAG: TPM domain-containing protein [Bacteroidales bacterium]|nr:TPM domain-containing protein [Bacteroidales bacterium]